MMDDHDTPTAQGSQDAVLAAVARESQRRRRVFGAYLVLLAVPLLAAALALRYGRSERAAIVPQVQAAIAPELREDVDRTVRSQVDSALGERLEPRVASIAREESARINQELVQRQDQLTARMEAVSRDVAALRGATGAVKDSRLPLRRVPDLAERSDPALEPGERAERRLDQLRTDQSRVEDATAGNSEEIRQLQARVAELEKVLAALRREEPR